jgi:hypothetical protein
MVESKAFRSSRGFSWLVPIVIFLLVACNSSPTVPLPPPEVINVTAPDEYGFVWVMGESEYGVDDIALVFNEDSEEGSMSPVLSDGSFEIEIEAEVGDTLVIQIMHDGVLSEEAVETVPSG